MHYTHGTCPRTATQARCCFVYAQTTLHSCTSSKAFQSCTSPSPELSERLSKQGYQSPVLFSEKSSFSKQPRNPHHLPPTLPGLSNRFSTEKQSSNLSQQSSSLLLKMLLRTAIHANPPQHVPVPPQVGGILTVCSASWGFSISLQHSSAVYCTSSLKLELHQCTQGPGKSMWVPRLVRAGLQHRFAVCNQEPTSHSSSPVTLTTESLPNTAFNKTELFHPGRQGGPSTNAAWVL